MLRRTVPASLVVLCASLPAAADLNEFDIADGYMGAFATPVWTYNPLWTHDGGVVGSNYVAQHGYGSGGAFNAPFGLVVRNDSPASNYQFSYDFTAFDLGGVNPNSISGPGAAVTIAFDVQPVFFQNSGTHNATPMLTMAFGGTAAAPGVEIGFSDGNYLMFSDALGNLSEFSAYQLGAFWHRIAVTLHFDTATWDLQVQPLSGTFGNESSTYVPFATHTVGVGMPMTNALSSLTSLYWETFTDPENNLGWHKGFFDNFDGRYVPAPGAASLLALGAVLAGRRRR